MGPPAYPASTWAEAGASTALLAEAQKEALGHQRKLRRTGTDSAPRLEEIAQKLVGPPVCPKMLATFLMRTPRRSDFFGWCRSGQECTLHLGSVDSTTVTAKSTEDVAKMAPDPDADEPAELALVRRSVAAGVASAWSNTLSPACAMLYCSTDMLVSTLPSNFEVLLCSRLTV